MYNKMTLLLLVGSRPLLVLLPTQTTKNATLQNDCIIALYQKCYGVFKRLLWTISKLYT